MSSREFHCYFLLAKSFGMFLVGSKETLAFGSLQNILEGMVGVVVFQQNVSKSRDMNITL
jgi:hypothetical protein